MAKKNKIKKNKYEYPKLYLKYDFFQYLWDIS